MADAEAAVQARLHPGGMGFAVAAIFNLPPEETATSAWTGRVGPRRPPACPSADCGSGVTSAAITATDIGRRGGPIGRVNRRPA